MVGLYFSVIPAECYGGYFLGNEGRRRRGFGRFPRGGG